MSALLTSGETDHIKAHHTTERPANIIFKDSNFMSFEDKSRNLFIIFVILN